MIEPRRAHLTRRRLDAIIEALVFRLAGEIEELPDGPTHADYRNALTWAQGMRDSPKHRRKGE